MVDLQKEKYKNLAEKAWFFLLIFVFVFVVSKCAMWLFGLLFPFFVSWIIALLIRPITVFLHKYTKVSKRVWSVFLVSAIVLGLGSILFFLLSKLVHELQDISCYITSNYEDIIDNVTNGISVLGEKLPIFKAFLSEEELLNAVFDSLSKSAVGLSSKIPSFITYLAKTFPNVLFLSVVLVTSAYYFCADYDKLKAAFLNALPKSVTVRLPVIKETFSNLGKKVIKGYLIIMLLTFATVYFGLTVLKVRYAFATSVIISLVDMLPIIGVGIVLVPWAVFKIVLGEYYVGFGLLILFGVVCIMREILEPKIIGKSIGLHPLLTLFAMYVGLKLFGFFGMIIFPFVITVIKNIK